MGVKGLTKVKKRLRGRESLAKQKAKATNKNNYVTFSQLIIIVFAQSFRHTLKLTDGT